MPLKGKRGLKFTLEEIDDLLGLVDNVVTIGHPKWELVWSHHTEKYGNRDQTLESLKCKFQILPHPFSILPTFFWLIVVCSLSSEGGLMPRQILFSSFFVMYFDTPKRRKNAHPTTIRVPLKES